MRIRAIIAAAAVLALAACAAQVPPMQPEEDGPANVSEQGLWLASRKAEQGAAMSGRRVDDRELEAYVREVNCRVSGSYCPEIRVYTMKVPDFNASMAPNGFEQVWTGLLLRVENEAQLATVLGHEAAHYVQRHTLERFETTRRTANLLLAAQMGLFFGGVGGISAGPVGISTGDIGQIIASGYLAAYSRDQEAEADDDGFEFMVDAGYAPGEAAKVWGHLMEEQRACDLPTPPALFASHPPSEERLKRLQTLAERSDEAGVTNRDAFLEATLPHRGEWLRMELNTRRFCRARVLLERLIEDGANVGELHYYRGELYRLRDEEGDTEKAIEAYRTALKHPSAPARTHRDLARVLWRADQTAQAQKAFRRYLEVADSPDDAAMIRAYLERLS